MPFMTSAVQLDEFLVDMLRVDAAAPLSPAVSEHAVAVAGRPAVTAHEAAVLLRGAAAVGSLCLTAGLARIWGRRRCATEMSASGTLHSLGWCCQNSQGQCLMQDIPHGGDSQAEAAMFVRYWWQVGPSPPQTYQTLHLAA